MKYAFIFSLLFIAAAQAQDPAPASNARVGPRPGGGYLLNSGWTVRPAGVQIPLDTLPMASLVSRDGRFLIVLNGGYNPPSLSVVDLASKKEISRTRVADAWLGMALSADGHRLWVGGGSTYSVFEFSFSDEGALVATRTIPLMDGKPTYRDFAGDVALSPDGKSLYVSDVFHDRVLVVNVQTGAVDKRYPTGRRPYKILPAPDGKSYYVTSWADGILYQHQADNGYKMNALALGAHPTDMVWTARKTSAEPDGDEAPEWDARIFVAAANTNNVYVAGVSGTSLSALETINVATTPRHPLGMTPSALALNAEETRLFVVCSDANTAAEVDVERRRSRVLGFIPTGWYPTAANVLSDGALVVLNGRGERSYPNPQGPSPVRRAAPYEAGSRAVQYVAHIQTGSASVIPAPDAAQLARYTGEVLTQSPYNDNQLDQPGVPAGNPIPSAEGAASPIQHVIYILKENRTYDQVLGDIGKGESDPSLVLFGEKVSPNHHKLARDFVLLDNFYVNADVSADGHNWSDAAIASDYVQKLWPSTYAKRRNHYDFEGGEPAALPAAGYLWTNAVAAGVSMRNYGHFVVNTAPAPAGGAQVASVKDGTLDAVTSRDYRGFDLDYRDVDRVGVFVRDLHAFEQANEMPKLIMLRLGNDHTYGSMPGKLSPLALFADNDYALGLLVDAVSHSKFWASTAIFVIEDDAQNGPDHIDSHRSPAFVVSPYTRQGKVDSTMYNTASVLRTLELILGLRPMTQFDAAAMPMWRAFANTPVTTPYDAEKPRISLTERNPAATRSQLRKSKLTDEDFREADRADDDELNAELWRAIRGGEPPPPVSSYIGGR